MTSDQKELLLWASDHVTIDREELTCFAAKMSSLLCSSVSFSAVFSKATLSLSCKQKTGPHNQQGMNCEINTKFNRDRTYLPAYICYNWPQQWTFHLAIHGRKWWLDPPASVGWLGRLPWPGSGGWAPSVSSSPPQPGDNNQTSQHHLRLPETIYTEIFEPFIPISVSKFLTGRILTTQKIN